MWAEEVGRLQILFNKWLQTFSVGAEWLASVSTSRNMPLTLKSVPRWFLSLLIICENKAALAVVKTSQYSERCHLHSLKIACSLFEHSSASKHCLLLIHS